MTENLCESTKSGRVDRKSPDLSRELRGGPEEVRGVGGTMVETTEEGTNPPDGGLTEVRRAGLSKCGGVICLGKGGRRERERRSGQGRLYWAE